MKNYRHLRLGSLCNSKTCLLLITLLATFLRLYQLGQNPPSLDWDEASLGYNAYSLLKTGRDEFGRVWPISLRSFEDYKPAVYAYLSLPVVAFVGLTEFAVRLPSALAGIFTILVTYVLVKELFNPNGQSYKISVQTSEKIALLASALLAVSPWHLQFSRVAFEANVALLFITLGAWTFFRGLKSGRWWLLSAVAFAGSFYTYHSPRLVVPLLLLGWVVCFRNRIWQRRKWVVGGMICFVVLLIPFLKETTTGRARLSSVTVVKPTEMLTESIDRIEYDQAQSDILGKLLHNRRIVYLKAITKGYLDHFNLDFLFLTGDAPLRHHARSMGMLYLWEAPFIAIGALFLLKKKGSSAPLFWWFLVAPAASSLTTGTPHAVRALTYLPIYQVFSAVGLLTFLTLSFRLFQGARKIGILTLFVLVGLNIYFYLESYYVHTPIEAAKDWQFGYKEATIEAAAYEKEVGKIVTTYAYDQPHIYTLFYRQIDPAWYQAQGTGGEVQRFERQFGIYEFRKLNWEEDQRLTNVLFVGTPGEIPDGTLGFIKDIYFPDGTVALRIVKR